MVVTNVVSSGGAETRLGFSSVSWKRTQWSPINTIQFIPSHNKGVTGLSQPHTLDVYQAVDSASPYLSNVRLAVASSVP